MFRILQIVQCVCSIGAFVVIYNAESNNIYVLSSVVVSFTKSMLLEMHICFMVDTKSIKEVCICVIESAYVFYIFFGKFDAFVHMCFYSFGV